MLERRPSQENRICRICSTLIVDDYDSVAVAAADVGMVYSEESGVRCGGGVCRFSFSKSSSSYCWIAYC